ncbi:MAG: aldo/keto reductase [Oscillospiraceae bacterium]|nr:aldo/keto reductase [Oscillospiraceae bacterium]
MNEMKKLGFGFMRLPRKGEGFDMAQINKMVDAFIENGGEHFDTAFVYRTEGAVNESVVKRHPREKFKVATKLNLRVMQSEKEIPDQFRSSITDLGVDYIDYYMLHGLDAKTSAERGEGWGAWDFIKALKAKGTVKNIGFSFHSTPADLEEILTKHPYVDFVQLQINYIDWENPKVESRGIYEVARKHNVPIFIMEPIKGGMLASEDNPATAKLKEANPGVSAASWAMRYAAGLEGVAVSLSGMSTFEQMQDNIKTFADFKPLSKDELAAVTRAVEIFQSIPRIGCTGCNYCEECPSKILIPSMLDAYNNYLVYNTTNNIEHAYRMASHWGAPAKECISCNACEQACPQKLEIVPVLKKLSELFD